MNVNLARLASALARGPFAVRAGAIVLASLLVFVMAALAGTSIGRAIFYLSR
jgi:hypothetical protein